MAQRTQQFHLLITFMEIMECLRWNQTDCEGMRSTGMWRWWCGELIWCGSLAPCQNQRSSQEGGALCHCDHDDGTN
eukprot:15165687-Ditylum_brightwellii.AAC.2